MASQSMEILICDARLGKPKLSPFTVHFLPSEAPTVGLALIQAGIAQSPEDPSLARKGCFGVFGKRKDWDSPIYEGDRLELFSTMCATLRYLIIVYTKPCRYIRLLAIEVL